MPNNVDPVSLPHDIQALFLNGARRERLEVTIQLTNRTRIDARIKSIDRFAVAIGHHGADELIFKHAIASIRPARAARPPSSTL